MPQRIKNKKERPDIVGGDIKVKNRVAYFGVFLAILKLLFRFRLESRELSLGWLI